MELCLLLLVVMAVGVASTDNNNNNNSSGGGGGSGSPFPSLQCGPVNRRGRRLWGKPRPVHPPSVCEKSAPSRGAVLCDEPGDDYPWEAIDNYLRQSSDVVKKRVENTLKASRIVAANAVRRRNARSADQVVKDSDAQEITFATDSSDKIRAKKHIDPPPVRQRVTVAKTTPPRPTTFGPELDDFTELVYASGTQRQPEEAEVAPPATRAPAPPPPSTVEPTPDPYTQSACDYWEELRSPFYAMNTHSEWKTLINMPNYETYIHMEHCKEDKSQGRCAEGCRCTQKFTIRNMPVYDRDINGCDVIYMDEFLFPSHCDCKCLPPGYTLFQRPPEPTTPLPEVAEFSESVPEGWLPERPTTGRNGQKEKEEEEEEKEVVREEVIEVEEADGEEEVVVVEVVEREKGEEKPVTSVGSPEKLKSDSPPSGDEERSESQEKGTEERRSQARPPPPAIRRHVTVRPRPRRPTAGPKLPSPRPAAGPLRWELLAQRQRPERRAAADSETSHRNRLRGPAEAPAELNRR
ncbi:uncharacterized protein LOC122394209 isoform X2 [Amphibalanus amphitrite]|uniref:uncharacterized protein LOC122394209 isoform X2 n=1 Tax=Amphibalanus amphitrite TaxID=1232801 RepID=UPI001C902C9E|nr:uncharacterized protein LOC122394209 isoform X2 [Amphibalanus amphitrite]